MVSFAQAIPEARDIINDFNNDIDLFLDEDREQIDIHTYVENRSARAFLPLFNMIRDLVDQIDHLSTGEAWDLAVVLSDEINALKSIINVLKSDLDKTRLALEASRKDSIVNTLPDDLEEKIRKLLGGAPKIESMEDEMKFQNLLRQLDELQTTNKTDDSGNTIVVREPTFLGEQNLFDENESKNTDMIDSYPLNTKSEKFKCDSYHDKMNYLEGWLRNILTKFKPSNRNIYISGIPYSSNRIFDYNSLAAAIGPLLTDDTSIRSSVKRFLKDISTGDLSLGAGIYMAVNFDGTQIPPNEPLRYVELIMGDVRNPDAMLSDWENDTEDEVLETYSICIHMKNHDNTRGPAFLCITGLNINYIHEELPELIEGINVLKKQIARVCNVRSNRLTLAGGKRRKLKLRRKLNYD
uniref:Uncharacterized protein n=1 Tax=viral metagenome TaxID=1070528 RepID=A0A6C0AGM8_9ZZZZ|tara:strand:- start:27575 stop:28804 length:1230 start_codon:yes stop_codon:yes gene_type:complete